MTLRTLKDLARRELQRADINPVLTPRAVPPIVERLVDEWREKSIIGSVPPIPEDEDIVTTIVDAICGLGPLQQFLDDPEVEEIWIDDPTRVFISKNGHTELSTLLLTEEVVRNLVERMLRASGRRLDMSSPFVDAALNDGSRLHVVIPPVTGSHWVVNIRKHLCKARRLADLVANSTLPFDAAEFLQAAVSSGLNCLVSGATQAGKTTLLRALMGAIPAAERIVSCEEVFELGLAARDCVAMQTRPPTMEGRGEITLRRLVKEALRMRPERLVIGEVREAEALDLLIALNAGLPGACTIHANSGRDALRKLMILPMLAGENVTSAFVIPTVADAIDLVIHIERDREGNRKVTEVLYVTGRVESQVIEMSTLWQMQQGHLLRGTGTCEVYERFSAAGFDLGKLLRKSA